jgi:hypothetical protein
VHAVKALARAASAAITLSSGQGGRHPDRSMRDRAFPASGTLDVLAPAQKFSNLVV